MAKFLDTDKAYAEMVDIVSKADTKLVLISPYIKIPENLLERLKYMDGKGIKIVVVCRKKDLTDEVRSDLKQLKNLELRFNENLHAKCFYNGESMIITSLNLYEYSQQHNREMGVLLSSKDDREAFNEACAEAEFIVNSAEKDSLVRNIFSRVVKEGKSMVDSLVQDESKGYCIRCGKSIPYNEKAPYCSDCFSKWSEGGGNPDYRERNGRCHACGESATPTKEKPLCNSCYRKSQRGR